MKTRSVFVRDLKPADIVVTADPNVRDVVIATRNITEHTIGVTTARRDQEAPVSVGEYEWSAVGSVSIVAAPELTPAQVFADELLELLRQAIASDEKTNGAPTPAWVTRALEVIDRIEPPQPVTVDEALFALQLLTEFRDTPGLSGQQGRAAEILERARKLGQLPPAANGGA